MVLLAIGWVGLQVDPKPLPDSGLLAGETMSVPVPDGLPAPVARFYRTVYGDTVPVVDSAVISGRGRMRIAGISFPARFRFAHVTGDAYRHYIELTLFGRRVVAVNEWFVDGTARLELPFGISDGPNVDQAANLALWAEAVWMPSLWITDPAVNWAAVDDASACLVVPSRDDEEAFTVRFDPETGLLVSMESLRFKAAGDETKTGWLNEAFEWGRVDGHTVPWRATVTWSDEGSPWADLHTEQALYNADLTRYVRAEGP